MNRLLEWMLGLERIRLDRDAPLSVFWRGDLPPWMLVPLTLLLACVVTLAYRSERGSRAGRTLLCGIRITLIGLVVAMICQPVLKLQRDRVEPSHVALLVDRSASMDVRDAATKHLADDATGAERSRIDAVRAAFLGQDAAALRFLLERNELELYLFGQDVGRVAIADGPDALPLVVAALERVTCDAAVTNVPAAIKEVLRRTERGRLAAIVLASDGRTTASVRLGEDDAIAAAKAMQVPVFPLLVGSPTPRRDVFVGAVSVQENVFLKDSAAMRVQVGATGLETPTEITVLLIDEDRDEEVASHTFLLQPDTTTKEIELRVKPARSGRIDYRVRIVPLEGEVDTENNLSRVRLNVSADRLRVLYVDGYPRYEYRYLKNALLREPTIVASCLLLSADPDFAQEGDEPIRRFPKSKEELNSYDVVLFGDVNPHDNWLSPEQMNMLLSFVAERGGGFGLLAGPRYAPGAFVGTPLEKLVPVRIDPDSHRSMLVTIESPSLASLTAEGRRHRLFRFAGEDSGDSSPGAAESLPGVYWVAPTLGIKPAAEVLAEVVAPGSFGTRLNRLPLFVLGRYGAGRVFFSGTDDTWRWRRGGDEWAFDAFWLQVCRALASPGNQGSDRRIVLRTDRPRYQYGQHVTVYADILDTDLLSSLGTECRVLVLDDVGEPVQRVTLTRMLHASGRFEGAFVPPRSGSFTAELDTDDPGAPTLAIADRQSSVLFHVAHADPESRQTHANHAFLRRLAAETGGAVMELDEIIEQTKAILDRSVRVPDDLLEPLWDSKLALGLFVLLIVAEWSLRKVIGLL